MRTVLIAMVLLFHYCHAQTRHRLLEDPKALSAAQKSIVSISARDSTFPGALYAIGTGVLVSVSGRLFVLTTGDQFTITDSSQKFVRHLSQFQVDLSNPDGTTRSIPASLACTDDDNDLIALDVPCFNEDSSAVSLFSLASIALTRRMSLADCHLGDSVLCICRRKAEREEWGSYLVTQTGTILRCFADRSLLLVGALLEEPEAGSGVFVTRQAGSCTVPILIGLARDANGETIASLLNGDGNMTDASWEEVDTHILGLVTSVDAIVPILISHCDSIHR